jgi:hypothetical protein
MLISRRVPGTEDIILSKLALANGQQSDLIQLSSARDLTLSPDGRYLVYQSRFNEEAEKNGMWLIDLNAARPEPERLPFLGAYRWRDKSHLVSIPFDPAVKIHRFYQYNVESGQAGRLFPAEDTNFNLTITNGSWEISPDGSKIALLAANGTVMDGLWVIDLN